MVHEWRQGEYLIITDREVIIAHPELQGLRKWVLFTRDTHGLYRQVGFTSISTCRIV